MFRIDYLQVDRSHEHNYEGADEEGDDDSPAPVYFSPELFFRCRIHGCRNFITCPGVGVFRRKSFRAISSIRYREERVASSTASF